MPDTPLRKTSKGTPHLWGWKKSVRRAWVQVLYKERFTRESRRVWNSCSGAQALMGGKYLFHNTLPLRLRCLLMDRNQEPSL